MVEIVVYPTMIRAIRRSFGEDNASFTPAKMLPPIFCCGGASARRGITSVSSAARPRNAAEIGRRFIGPTFGARIAVSAGPAIAPAGRNDSVEPACGCLVVDVGHQTPEHRDDEKVQDADADEETNAPGDDAAPLQAAPRREEQHRAENIRRGCDHPAAHSRDDPAENRYEKQRRHERPGEQPWEIVDAGAGSDLITHGAQNKIAAEDGKEGQKWNGGTHD